MTDDEKELKLQAFFDGELPEAEAREVAAWIARDRDAADLQKELRNTRQALAGFEQGINVPESREFYWSKIAREIERTERLEPVKTRVSALVWLRRLLLPVVGLAMVVAAVVFLWQPSPVEAEPEFESTTDDCGAMTYRDEDAGMTVVWFSYDSEHQDQGTSTQIK
jgi:anti-sigma factor RsiW